MVKICSFFLLLVCLFSCRNKHELKNIITTNDFEAISGWGPEIPSLSSERAHSGRYALKVDEKNEYSIGYNKELGEAILKRTKINLTAWVYIPDESSGNASIVFSVIDPANNQTILWEGIKLGALKDVREWVKISRVFELPVNVKSTDKLQVYLWRAEASKPVFLDDLTLAIVD